MKARIQQEPRCVLLWQVAPGSAEHAAVEHAARLSRLKVRLLTAADLGTTIEALCTGRHTGGEAAPAPDVPERPAMIVSGLRHDSCRKIQKPVLIWYNNRTHFSKNEFIL